MKKLLIIIPLFLLAALCAFAQNQFDWTIALVNRAGDAVIAADRPVQLRTGEVFTFLLKSSADCFVYVVAQGSDNSIFVIHSGALKKDDELKVGPLELTAPSGTETFYVVVSASSQRKLDRAAATLAKNSKSTRNARAVLNEVLAVRRDLSALNAVPEQPVYMGGAFRGNEVQALKFSGADTYVRTFTLSH